MNLWKYETNMRMWTNIISWQKFQTIMLQLLDIVITSFILSLFACMHVIWCASSTIDGILTIIYDN